MSNLIDSNAFQNAVETFTESFLRGKVHVCMPGIIEEVTDNSDAPRATVQPGYMLVRDGEDEARKRSPIPDVPLIFPRFGSYEVVSSVDAGTEVLLVMSERSRDMWMQQGGSVDPVSNRMFSISDAFAILGTTSLGKPLEASLPDDGIAMRKADGSVSVSINDDEIAIANSNGVATLKSNGQLDVNGNFTVDA